MHTHDLAAAFNKRFGTGKKESAIRSALGNHKILCGRPHGKRLITQPRLLTPEQHRFVEIEYKKHTVKEVTSLLNKEFETKFTYQQIKTYVHNNKVQSGRTGRFEKGHINWNKGTKGLCKPNSGSFKKGDPPANVRSLGSERIDNKDGYIWIKVAEWDHNFDRPTRWKLKHVHVWEQENGPVPDGFVLRFIDADKTNINISNIMMVSNALNLRLNKNDYNNSPSDLKPQILALSKLEVLTFSKIKE